MILFIRQNCLSAPGTVLSLVLFFLISGKVNAQNAEEIVHNLPINDLVFELSRLTHKEALFKQNLSGVKLNQSTLDQIAEGGEVRLASPQKAIITPIGSELICILDGQYTLQDTFYDASSDSLMANLRLDESQSNIVCNGFTNDLAGSVACSQREPDKKVPIQGQHLQESCDACVIQMRSLLTQYIDEETLAYYRDKMKVADTPATSSQ